MENSNNFEVIIVGGSYAGLSAAMALGRSLRKVLVIDSGLPCNRQTPHSHNFITQDGNTPEEIANTARKQVEKYDTVSFYKGLVTEGAKTTNGFEITTESKDKFIAKKLIFATGIRDIMLDIPGFAECWGISIIHCPYCHGYEVKNEKTGILGNGDYAFEFSRMINNWTKELTVFTNGVSSLSDEQKEKLAEHDIAIVETEIESIEHSSGRLAHIVFKDGSKTQLKAMYAQAPFVQHCGIPEKLGCALTEHGYLEVNTFQQTTVAGVYACGDNTVFMRSVANAVATGGVAGAVVNKELIEEAF